MSTGRPARCMSMACSRSVASRASRPRSGFSSRQSYRHRKCLPHGATRSAASGSRNEGHVPFIAPRQKHHARSRHSSSPDRQGRQHDRRPSLLPVRCQRRVSPGRITARGCAAAVSVGVEVGPNGRDAPRCRRHGGEYHAALRGSVARDESAGCTRIECWRCRPLHCRGRRCRTAIQSIATCGRSVGRASCGSRRSSHLHSRGRRHVTGGRRRNHCCVCVSRARNGDRPWHRAWRAGWVRYHSSTGGCCRGDYQRRAARGGHNGRVRWQSATHGHGREGGPGPRPRRQLGRRGWHDPAHSALTTAAVPGR